MSETQRARLILDPPLPGVWNMAVDEALLESAADGTPCLRFYRWIEPTLSLGYFQPLAQRGEHAASRDCPLVRRASGGGAIVHDRELTYSFTAPINQRFASSIAEFYYAFHETLLEALNDLGIAGKLCQPNSEPARAADSFLCFERRTAGDVLCGHFKIGGSAQRRQRGALLQHGSVLLGKSIAAPELPGILELAGNELSPAELQLRWGKALVGRLKLPLDPAELSTTERQRAEEIVRERFGHAGWTGRR